MAAPSPSERAGGEVLSAAYEALVKNIYDGVIETGAIDKATTLETVNKLMAGLFDGYGSALDQVDYESPDYEMLSHLTRNVYQFSAAKNYQEIKSLTEAIVDGDRIREFTEYKDVAHKILGDFTGPWLQTEYNGAVAGAQMASKWVEFQKGADDMPYLQYRTVGDERVREEHRLLDGVVKAITDAFWKTYYPPNGWNCRCSVIQLPTAHAHETPNNRITFPDIPPMFQTNLAQKRLVFPPGSPYFVGLPKEIRKADITLQRNEVRTWAKQNLVGKTLPSSIGDINITGTGMKEAVNQNHDFEFEKNSALYRLPQLLRDAVYINSAPDDKGKPFIYHYLETTIAKNKSYINIREDMKGNKSFYTITDHLKKHK